MTKQEIFTQQDLQNKKAYIDKQFVFDCMDSYCSEAILQVIDKLIAIGLTPYSREYIIEKLNEQP